MDLHSYTFFNSKIDRKDNSMVLKLIGQRKSSKIIHTLQKKTATVKLSELEMLKLDHLNFK